MVASFEPLQNRLLGSAACAGSQARDVTHLLCPAHCMMSLDTRRRSAGILLLLFAISLDLDRQYPLCMKFGDTNDNSGLQPEIKGHFYSLEKADEG